MKCFVPIFYCIFENERKKMCAAGPLKSAKYLLSLI